MGNLNQNSKLSGSGGGSSSGGGTATGSQQFTATTGQTQFTATLYTVNASYGKAYVDGVFQTNEKFSISGQVYTFTTPFLGGEIINITN